MDPERIKNNITYVKIPLEDAYEQCFGDAVREYNAGQKRKDRQKGNYLEEIRHSGNREKIFYENVVQIGTMKDTPVMVQDGNLTGEAKKAVCVLNQYAETFQERNPNLFLFNAVLHLDEATPHLHLDYIPVAHGYKQGMKTRNSLTKALQEMGFKKGRNRKNNETIDWQNRERAYISELCAEQGIEITVIGVDRDNYSLPEYKEIMRKITEKEEEIEILNNEKETTKSELFQLHEEQSELLLETNELKKQIQMELESAKESLEQYQIAKNIMDSVNNEVQADLNHVKRKTVLSRNLLNKEEYVKVPKKLWIQMLTAYKWALRQTKSIQKLTLQVQQLKSNTTATNSKLTEYRSFLQKQGLQQLFEEFIHPKKSSVREELQNKQKQISQQKDTEKQHQTKKEAVSEKMELQ